ncbi:hypothetical protein [Virgibacillus alimentarius]|uniref:Peptidase M50 domain-containing protein n=1 Tax=Virgibacillus alimentarius TaxID=698769 RepID=A0ABS4S4J9_9BACI|nr:MULTISPECIES: hypothetical protein [Virgibacillus]MBP2256420.1 hypothetical protein [Virgibacillus alimentarius]HLR66365.1 hypothetical protein [Virgibacillus sp.]
MDIYLLLFLVFVVAPISMVIHESGHLIGAKTMRADHITLSIGLGKMIGSLSFKKIHIKFHTVFFLGGLLKSERTPTYKPLEIIWVTICGLLSSGLFTILFYLLYNIYTNYYIQLLFLFNGWLFIVNTIPFKIKGKQSDGYMIYKIILQIIQK